MENIMVIIAAIVAALLVGPAVAVGAVIDNRKVRNLAGLLRSRLEAVSDELGRALWRAAEAERSLDAAKRRIADLEATEKWLEESREFWRDAFERADSQAERLSKALMAEQERCADILLKEKDAVEILNKLADEVASLRKQRRYLVGQRDEYKREGLKLIAQRRDLVGQRIALESFIEEAYGPLDECEISTRRICALCETIDVAGGSACEVCDRPF